MSSRKRPNLAPVPAVWIAPDVFPKHLHDELLLHLQSSPLTSDQKRELIAYCGTLAQLPADLTPMAVQNDQLEAVASNARRLLASLAGLSDSARDAIAAHARDLEGFPERIPENDLLSSAWEVVHRLEVAADYTKAQLEMDRQSKPAQHRARSLVGALASYLIRKTGKAPPKDRSAWFAAFSGCFGAHLGLEIGPRIVANAVASVTR
ncbi:hypothetical protein ACRS57_03665 [Pseudomonas aeruginosa]|uniref:hypothetical protein n=1 Tax=Pseudomonas aeruginosa TaxID=287 RepID=UPI0032E46A35